MKNSELNNDEQNLDESPTNRLPSIWKTLPSVALPVSFFSNSFFIISN